MTLHRPSPRRRPAGFIPRVEFLEDRRVPTCTAFQAGGLLTITGTSPRNVLQIGDDGGGSVALLCSGDLTPRLFHGVSQINVKAGRGSTVHYDLFGTVNTPHALTVNLGAGRQNFVAYLNSNGIGNLGNDRITVNGGRGNDRMLVQFGADPNAQLVSELTKALSTPPFPNFSQGVIAFGITPGVDIAQNGNLRINLNGGPGNDTIAVNYEGTLAGSPPTVANPFALGVPGVAGLNPGTLTLNLNGGAGHDVIAAQVLALAGSTGRVVARENGGPGNDGLGLIVRQEQVATAAAQQNSISVDALLDGGAGRNSCTRTPNVLEINCQSDTVEPAFVVTNPGTPGSVT
jgi:hypothetical protein